MCERVEVKSANRPVSICVRLQGSNVDTYRVAATISEPAAPSVTLSSTSTMMLASDEELMSTSWLSGTCRISLRAKQVSCDPLFEGLPNGAAYLASMKL